MCTTELNESSTASHDKKSVSAESNAEIPISLDLEKIPAVVVMADQEAKDKYTFLQACGFNTMMMFGTGPFISIPYCIHATSPSGPQALIGYAIAAFGCACDSLIWGELGSRFPLSGGSLVYLRKLYGEENWGRLASFLYVWQFWITGPAEIASGFIAIAEYLAYIHGDSSYLTASCTAASLLMITICLLYRRIDDIGRMTLVLWAVTIFAITFTIIAGFINFDHENLKLPSDAFDNTGRFVMSLSAACRFAIYDFTGYYDVCSMGAEVENPRKTIPGSCIITCLVVLVVFFATYIAVLGYLPWYGEEGFIQQLENGEVYIMGDFYDKMLGRGFAVFFVLIVCITIFGSVFSMITGMQYLPVRAAEDGIFFSWFGAKSEKHQGLPYNSLLTIGLLSFFWCWFSLETVIAALTVMLVLVQFIGQSVGILVYRYAGVMKEEDPEAWKMPWFPYPAILQLMVFSFIYVTSDNYVISGGEPMIELSLAFILLGCGLYLAIAHNSSEWPFNNASLSVNVAIEEARISCVVGCTPIGVSQSFDTKGSSVTDNVIFARRSLDDTTPKARAFE
ncbi:hypothetical protein CYMTET_21762 [Cymbomonas tetramitiformis]|uniref:Amino acid transporter n=1 Tax=Cymbomonas tetramitiformis TaxID=36881 RepID=A0AAE0L2Y8_9CHLO|nr:hypothetical protein CYMTET_21762 [Cymbomonas tetramitiformis]|eukprot:gene12363-14605_t